MQIKCFIWRLNTHIKWFSGARTSDIWITFSTISFKYDNRIYNFSKTFTYDVLSIYIYDEPANKLVNKQKQTWIINYKIIFSHYTKFCETSTTQCDVNFIITSNQIIYIYIHIRIYLLSFISLGKIISTCLWGYKKSWSIRNESRFWFSFWNSFTFILFLLRGGKCGQIFLHPSIGHMI